MRIAPDALIPREKLTNYLLVARPSDDKSSYLASAGFNQSTVDLLDKEVRRLSSEADAKIERVNQHGTYYTVSGLIVGPSGVELAVKLVWIERLDGVVSFVTLIPTPGSLP